MKRSVLFPLILTANVLWPQSVQAQIGNQFVVVGANGTVLTSSNGITWVRRTTVTSNQLNSVVAAGSQLVAVGNGGTVITSPNGVNWMIRSPGIMTNLNSVTWTGSQLVAVGDNSMVLSSHDGINWSVRNPGIGSDFRLLSGVWNGNKLVCVGGGVTAVNSCPWIIITSPDGISWNNVSSGNCLLLCITWTGSQFVAGGTDWIGLGMTLSPFLLTSSDGNSWGIHYAQPYLISIVWNGSQMVGAAVTRGCINISYDLNTWTEISGISGICCVNYGNGLNIAVGEKGSIQTSPDAVIWTSENSGTTNSLRSVIWASNTSIKPVPITTAAANTALQINTHSSLLSIILPSPMLNGTVDLAVYSASGRVVMRKRVAAVTERFSLPAAGLATGAYVLSVKDGNRQKAVRFVVTR